MEELSKLLMELLLTHNRVSLPGIGAFLAASQPSSIDEQANTMTPPSKEITFSKTETWDDGLLRDLYAQRDGLSESEANEKIKFLMMDIRFELDDKGKVIFAGLGCLRQGQTHDINFEQNKKTNLNADSFGLQEFPLPPKKTGEKKKIFEKITTEKKVSVEKVKITSPSKVAISKILSVPKRNPFTPHNIALIVLAGLLSIMVATGIYLFLSRGTDKNQEELTGKPAPVSSADAAIDKTVYDQIEQDQNTEYDEDQEYNMPVSETQPEEITATSSSKKVSKEKEYAPAPKSTTPTKAPAINPPSRNTTQYCIIIANFGTREAAQQKIKMFVNMGYKNSHIADEKNGRFRIATDCYSNEATARRELATVKGVVPDAWLLEKR